MNNPKTHSEICGQRISRGTISQWANSCTPPHHTPKTRFFPNHQPQSKQIIPWLEILSTLQLEKKVQVNGYTILLDEGQGDPKRPFRLLETRKSKHGGLLHETSPIISP